MDKKSKELTAVLALFLGGIGLHRMIGLLYLAMCWTWIPALIAVGEAVYFMFSLSTPEFDALYNKPSQV
jgi:TM2 domain-containing membrane protein YozV